MSVSFWPFSSLLEARSAMARPAARPCPSARQSELEVVAKKLHKSALNLLKSLARVTLCAGAHPVAGALRARLGPPDFDLKVALTTLVRPNRMG
jgi:hypothetical protein